MMFWIELDIICAFCVQVIHMPFWGEVDSFFTFFCMQASIIMFWIEFYLISTFFCTRPWPAFGRRA